MATSGSAQRSHPCIATRERSPPSSRTGTRAGSRRIAPVATRTGRTQFIRTLGGRSANTGQVRRDALVEADDPVGELLHGGDEGQPDGGHNQGVLHEVLALLIPNELNYE